MSLFWQYTSLMLAPPSASPPPRKKWYDKVHSMIRGRRKKEELANCRIRTVDLFYSSILFVAFKEASWWIDVNTTEYNARRRLILPRLDSKSLLSVREWKIYWIEVKQRVLPPFFKYQSAVFLLRFLQFLAAVFTSPQTLLRLTQHPPRRALAIAARESDAVSVGMEAFVVSLWANFLFFAASFLSEQLGELYRFHRERMFKIDRGHTKAITREELEDLVDDSVWTFQAHSRRYFYSSLGGGLGSVFWPGWGTLLGIGLGEAWTDWKPAAKHGETMLSLIHGAVDRMFQLFSRGQPQEEGEDAKKSVSNDELLCGCCQTTFFSSSPNSRDRAPISSRTCEHTICRSCVQQCHLALMERTSNYEEWIKCPLCNAEQAFSSHNHLVNRSLCAAIAAMEKEKQL